MLSSRRLRTFGETKESREEQFDLYYPGRIDRFFPLFNPFSEGEMEDFVSAKNWTEYSKGWKIPKRVKGIPGDTLARYKTGESFRRWGKERVGRRLKLLPSPQNEVQPDYFNQLIEMPVPPIVFLDGVPSYGEIPFGTRRAAFGQAEPERGEWGELISAITESGKMVLGLETAKYQARIAETQAKQVEAGLSWTDRYSKYLPYLLVGVGGIILLSKKRR